MKMTTHPNRIFTVAALCLLVAVTGCKKETSQTGTQDETHFTTVSSQADAEASTIFDDVFDNVMGVNAEVALGETGVFGRVAQADSAYNPCYTISITSLNPSSLFPVKVVVDFGSGCVGRDGRTRKGKIIAVYTGRMIIPGKVAEVTFDGYHVNDVHVEGILRIANASTSQALVFTVLVKDGKLTRANGNFTQWDSEKTITQTDGLGTPYWAKDDVFSIEGKADGSVKYNAEFFTWTSEITEPLIKKFSCHYLVAGRLSVGRSNTGAAIIDFGDGECDNKATLIINGQSTEITLH